MESQQIQAVQDEREHRSDIVAETVGFTPIDRSRKTEKDYPPYDLNFSITCLLRNRERSPFKRNQRSRNADVNSDDDHSIHTDERVSHGFSFSEDTPNVQCTPMIIKPTPIRATSGFCNALLCAQMLPYEEPHTDSIYSKSIANITSTKIIASQLQNNLQISQSFKQVLPQYEATTTTTGCVQNSNSGKRKRSWSRAVFSNLQRKGLEIQFQIQKYITKPDRRKLAATLNLTDAQVKVWFQNRRMKWRHSRGNYRNKAEKSPGEKSPYEDNSDENEIDVVAD